MKTNKPKYEIGQRVNGINGVNATIVGYVTGKYYNKMSFELNNTIPPYDKEYSNWKNEFVYYLEFDEPVRSCTYEEFFDWYKDRYDIEVIEKQYKEMRKVYSMTVPEFSIKPIEN